MVTVDDVRLIFATPMFDEQLEAFLQAAVNLVQIELSEKGLTEDQINDITKFLAAHLASSMTMSTLRERIGRDYEMWRTGLFGEGLKSTMYGQSVLLLDTSGTLQALGKKQRVSFKVITRRSSNGSN